MNVMKINHLPTINNRSQQGVALIVVLMVLIMIMLVGAIAVRQSNTDLKLATSDQINTLLLQGADGANVKLENLVNGNPDSDGYKLGVINSDGILGYFINNWADRRLHEVSFCYNPRILQPSTLTATVRNATGGYVDGLQRGDCNPNASNNYISARQTVMTQVSIHPLPVSTAECPFCDASEAVDLNGKTNTNVKPKFEIRATSAIPSYNDPGTCFSNSSVKSIATAKGTSTLLECLRNQQVPSKQLYEQADVAYINNAFKCINMGKGSGSALSVDDGNGGNKCALP